MEYASGFSTSNGVSIIISKKFLGLSIYFNKSEYFRISHLSVSNTTPPPATSPVNIKVKSEPQSPPRDLSGGHQQNSNGSTQHNTTNNNNNSNATNGGSGINNHSNLSANNLNNSLSISTHGLGVGAGGGGVIAGTSPGGAGGGGGGASAGGGASNSSSTSNGSANDQATNLSVLNHTQQHLVMAGSRPSSTGGHLTPTPGMY